MNQRIKTNGGVLYGAERRQVEEAHGEVGPKAQLLGGDGPKQTMAIHTEGRG